MGRPSRRPSNRPRGDADGSARPPRGSSSQRRGASSGEARKGTNADEILAAFERSRKALIARYELEAWEKSIKDAFAAHRTDTAARAIVDDFIERGKPFALFLRTFTQESYDIHKPATTDDPERRRVGIWGGVSDIEIALSNGLPDTVPMLAIANPFDLMSVDLRFPRLELSGGRWTDAVDGLIRAASFIVVVVDALAPGVVRELDAIVWNGRQNATVVILAKDRHQDIRTLHEPLGFNFPKHPQTTTHDPRLAAFPRIVGEEESSLERLRSSSLFADLLADHDARADRSADPDILRNRAALAHACAVYLLSVGRGEHDAEDVEATSRFEEAAPLAWKAFRLYVEAEDQAGMARTLIDIGRCYLDARQYTDAIKAFRDSGTYYRARLRDERGFRRAAVWVGLAHHLSGDRSGALGCLNAVLELERKAETGAVVDALELMARIYRDAGDIESARNCLMDLRAAKRRAKRRAARSKSLPSQ
jgi:tetratricopeptide (TPR) repeat protein